MGCQPELSGKAQDEPPSGLKFDTELHVIIVVLRCRWLRMLSKGPAAQMWLLDRMLGLLRSQTGDRIVIVSNYTQVAYPYALSLCMRRMSDRNYTHMLYPCACEELGTIAHCALFQTLDIVSQLCKERFFHPEVVANESMWMQ